MSRTRIFWGLALAFGVLLIAELLLLSSARELRGVEPLIRRARDVINQLELVVNSLSDAENGRRGFVITGDERYLTHRHNGFERAQAALAELRRLTADVPARQAQCDELERLIDRRLAISTASTEDRQPNGLDPGAQRRWIEEGQNAMEPIRALVARMQAEERELLKERRALLDGKAEGAAGLAVLVSLLGFATFATLSVLLVRANHRQRLAEETLQRANQELEIRVKERTAELRETVAKLEWADEFRGKVMESASFGLCVISPEGKFTMVNKQFAAITGYASEELLGMSYFLLFAPDDAAALHPLVVGALHNRQPVTNYEIELIRKDGSKAHAALGWSPLITREGVTGLVGTLLDITEEHQAQIGLRESESRLRSIIDSSLDAVITISADGLITGWNPQAERVFGWKAAEVQGRSLSETIIPERYRSAHEAGLRRYTRTRQPRILNKLVEFTALDRNGREFPVELAITPIQTGGHEGFSAFLRDISDRKDSENRLRAKLARLDLLSRTTRAIGERQDLGSILQVVLHSLEDHLAVDFACACAYDENAKTLTLGNIGPRSQTLAAALSLKQGAVIDLAGNELARCVSGDIICEPDLSQIRSPFLTRLSALGARAAVISPLKLREKVFGVLIVARRGPSTFTSGECEFLRQLSEHVALAAHQAQLYGQLQSAYDDLRRTQQNVMQQERLRALGQMAGGVAHDINNAIVPIGLHAELLLKNPSVNAQGVEHLKIIQRAIADVAQTVTRMGQFYRQRDSATELVAVSLNPLVEQVLELTRVRWSDMSQHRGALIQVVTDLSPDAPPIRGVEGEIRDALINLVFNAVDAMPGGGTLTLRTRVERAAGAEERVIVEVSDTGNGMDEETRKRCLEPFFTTKGERGTGLGLAMVYGVAQRHGAELEVESAPGKGTTMRLRFRPAPQTPKAVSPAVQAEAPRGLRILVVDDDPLVSATLSHVLRADGHRVATCDGGEKGLEAFQTAVDTPEAFDVVITDLGMPRVDGSQVAAGIKRASPSTPVILLTGWGARMDNGEESRPNVDVILGKPPTLAQLREALSSVCRRPPQAG